jgi:hypothetical protein
VTLAFLVAPVTSDGHNTIRPPLGPVACWRMDDVHFAFGLSAIAPAAIGVFGRLALVRADHPGSLLALFGHADPAGEDVANKELSGRRAIAVFAALTRQPALWEDLHSRSAGSDRWDNTTLQTMHEALGRPLPMGTAYATAGPRAELFTKYMDLLCRTVDGHAYTLDPAQDFLGRGADASHRGACQGCSEFNPVLVFSRTEQSAFDDDPDKTGRNLANEPNRRVVGMLFPADTSIDLKAWPCPAPTTGASLCKKRFWSDGETRRAPEASRRTFNQTEDTYACRFYHRLIAGLPCSGHGPVTVTRVLLQRYPGAAADDDGPGIADLPYLVDIVGQTQREGRTGGDGGITVMMDADATAIVQVFGTTFKFEVPEQPIEPATTIAGMQRRLALLGYGVAGVDGTVDESTDRAVLQFQADQALDPDGDHALDDPGTPSSDISNRLVTDSGA